MNLFESLMNENKKVSKRERRIKQLQESSWMIQANKSGYSFKDLARQYESETGVNIYKEDANIKDFLRWVKDLLGVDDLTPTNESKNKKLKEGSRNKSYHAIAKVPIGYNDFGGEFELTEKGKEKFDRLILSQLPSEVQWTGNEIIAPVDFDDSGFDINKIISIAADKMINLDSPRFWSSPYKESIQGKNKKLEGYKKVSRDDPNKYICQCMDCGYEEEMTPAEYDGCCPRCHEHHGFIMFDGETGEDIEVVDDLSESFDEDDEKEVREPRKKIRESTPVDISEYEYITTRQNGSDIYSLYRKIGSDGKGHWAAWKQKMGDNVGDPIEITYRQAQGFDLIDDSGINRLSRDLGKLLLPREGRR